MKIESIGERMEPSTGLIGLDKILHGIKAGDNIVWQVDSIEDYMCLVRPYIKYAISTKRKLVYFRFAKHRELVAKDSGAQIYQLNPEAGFELFITTIHEIIKKTGIGGYYVFDSHSELALDQYSDRMLFRNDSVRVELKDQTMVGILLGINELGYLKLSTGTGAITISTGDLWRLNGRSK